MSDFDAFAEQFEEELARDLTLPSRAADRFWFRYDMVIEQARQDWYHPDWDRQDRNCRYRNDPLWDPQNGGLVRNIEDVARAMRKRHLEQAVKQLAAKLDPKREFHLYVQ